MHPDLHRVYHERYDCNFPMLTGWTNRYVQFLYEASVRCGLVETGLGQKPTTIGPTKSELSSIHHHRSRAPTP